MTEELAWKVYNFINEWKEGIYGAVTLKDAIDRYFEKEPEEKEKGKWMCYECKWLSYDIFGSSVCLFDEVKGVGQYDPSCENFESR